MASPQLGYNTNVRHRGKVFHIQTEDSGTQHAHIFTHLFADGGRIICTRKTSYAEHNNTPDYAATVKRLMQAQHKAMFIALREGLFDEDERKGAEAFAKRAIALVDNDKQPGDVEAFDRAVQNAETRQQHPVSGAAVKAPSAVKVPPPPPPPAQVAAPYHEPVPAIAAQPATASPPQPAQSQGLGSLFGATLVSERSLDEVIMSYLSEEDERK